MSGARAGLVLAHKHLDELHLHGNDGAAQAHRQLRQGLAKDEGRGRGEGEAGEI